MAKELVKVQNLKKYFKVKRGLLHAVDDVTFSIKEKETLGVVGESGCGKSTLGRINLRLIEPTAGEIFFDGDDVMKLRGEHLRVARRQMQIIFQDPYSSLNPRKSISEIIEEPLIVHNMCKSKAELKKKVYTYMDLVGLSRRLVNTYPHELDGGRRQRIGVARALALEPKYIVCDEPVSALDVSIQAQILNLLQDLQKEVGLTYMFITHNLSVVRHISDEIAVMYLGKIVEKAKTEDLFNNPKHPYTIALLNAVPLPSIEYRYKKLTVIKGELSSPINPKTGCRFAPRCTSVEERCQTADPELLEISAHHFVSCFTAKNLT